MAKTEIMAMIQAYVGDFGIGINKQELVHWVYRYMEELGHNTCIINDRYIDVDGNEFQFIKSKKQYRWIVKEF